MIQPPKWAKGAYPTERGWVRNGELLISTRISKDDIEKWGNTEVAKAPVEESVDFSDLESMTKKELDEFALDKGIELDRRYSKKSMIEKFREKFSKTE